MIYALDGDMLSWSVTKVFKHFVEKAESMKKTYTDPTDKLLYMPKLLNVKPVDMFADYILMYAKMHVESGVRDYGEYNKQILNYQRYES
jgi:hypothetical protein